MPAFLAPDMPGDEPAARNPFIYQFEASQDTRSFKMSSTSQVPSTESNPTFSAGFSIGVADRNNRAKSKRAKWRQKAQPPSTATNDAPPFVFREHATHEPVPEAVPEAVPEEHPAQTPSPPPAPTFRNDNNVEDPLPPPPAWSKSKFDDTTAPSGFSIGTNPKKEKKNRRDDIRRRLRNVGRSSNNPVPEPPPAEETAHDEPLPFEIPLPPSPKESNDHEKKLHETFSSMDIQDNKPPPSANVISAEDATRRFCREHTTTKAALRGLQRIQCWECKRVFVTGWDGIIYCEACSTANNACAIMGCNRPLMKPRDRQEDKKRVSGRRVILEAVLPSSKPVTPKWAIFKKAGGKAYSDGNFIEAIDQYSKALDVLERLLASSFHPDLQVEKAKVLSNRAAAFIMVDKVKEGLQDSQASVENDPTYLRAHLRAAKCHLLLGNWMAAKDVYASVESLLTCNPNHPQLKTYTAQLQDGLHMVKSLESFLQQASDLSKSNDTQSALRMLELAMDIASASRELRVQKMKLLMTMREFTIAGQYCAKMIQDGGHAGAHGLGIELGLLYAQSLHYDEKTDEATRILQQLERAAPTSTEILRTKNLWAAMVEVRSAANNTFKAGNYDSAILLYSKALQLDKEHNAYNATMLSNRAAAYMALNLFYKALDDCNMALTKNAKFVKVVLRRARCYLALKQFKECIQDFDTYMKDGNLSPDELRAIKSERDQAKKDWDHAKKPKQYYDNYSWDGYDDFDSYNFRSTYGQQNYGHRDSYPKHNHHNRGAKGNKQQQQQQKGSSRSRYTAAPPPPPPAPKKTHYEILNVPPTATVEEIKKSYRKLALIYHPDKAKKPEDGELFKEMTSAYAVLSDSHAKAKYDKELRYKARGMYF
ncbi:hypothetical protein LEN26_020856 [Aphanomyces euteiches]|nr:hypothetical protein LEN26_020856 [Aphanomyces euteiches]